MLCCSERHKEVNDSPSSMYRRLREVDEGVKHDQNSVSIMYTNSKTIFKNKKFKKYLHLDKQVDLIKCQVTVTFTKNILHNEI
jgi:hypothetical protein